MIKQVFSIALLCGLFSACDGQSLTSDVPAIYKEQLLTLRNESIDAEKKCQDLAREQQELQARINWDKQRMDTIAAQALIASGHTSGKFIVNTATMKIVLRGSE